MRRGRRGRIRTNNRVVLRNISMYKSERRAHNLMKSKPIKRAQWNKTNCNDTQRGESSVSDRETTVLHSAIPVTTRREVNYKYSEHRVKVEHKYETYSSVSDRETTEETRRQESSLYTYRSSICKQTKERPYIVARTDWTDTEQ